jgi:hypothetical protein
LARCLGPSDTLSLKSNYDGLPIFIIHGSKDDNVPVREARKMVKELEPFHRDFVYKEVEGVKHWWDRSKAPGADCVDMAELFDFFEKHKRIPAPRRVTFKTWNPGVSAARRWLRIEGQETLLGLSSAEVFARPGLSLLELKTKNVSRLSFDPAPHFAPGEIKVRSGEAETAVPWDGKGRVHLEKAGEGWKPAAPPADGMKRPGRYGPFKAVFRHRFALVYGTGGTERENALALARARFDAQTWWYRGNGAAEVLPDARFDPEQFKGRNVVLYGHADQNAAFAKLGFGRPVRPAEPPWAETTSWAWWADRDPGACSPRSASPTCGPSCSSPTGSPSTGASPAGACRASWAWGSSARTGASKRARCGRRTQRRGRRPRRKKGSDSVRPWSVRP